MADYRVSYFSAWTGPEHVMVDSCNLHEAIDNGRAEQKGIVITNCEDEPPTSWNGPGLDDRRDA